MSSDKCSHPPRYPLPGSVRGPHGGSVEGQRARRLTARTTRTEGALHSPAPPALAHSLARSLGTFLNLPSQLARTMEGPLPSEVISGPAGRWGRKRPRRAAGTRHLLGHARPSRFQFESELIPAPRLRRCCRFDPGRRAGRVLAALISR